MKLRPSRFGSRKSDGPLDRSKRQQLREQWLTDNRDAIADYNREVARRGVFSEGLRYF